MNNIKTAKKKPTPPQTTASTAIGTQGKQIRIYLKNVVVVVAFIVPYSLEIVQKYTPNRFPPLLFPLEHEPKVKLNPSIDVINRIVRGDQSKSLYCIGCLYMIIDLEILCP